MKNFLLTCILFLFVSATHAQVESSSASTFSVVAIPGSNRTWSSITNAAPSDNAYASFGNLTGGVGSYTDYLVATGFGFAIPSGVTIEGIIVTVERSDPNVRTSDYSIRIVKGGVIGASEHSSGSPYLTLDQYQAYGGSIDLWGETWTEADINASNFGVAIAAQRSNPGGTTAGRVDDIQITVFYNFITLPVKLANFVSEKKKNSVELRWTTTEESNMNTYEVQRSSNGRDFTTIQSITSRNSYLQTSYSAVDMQPRNGINFYRLKMVEKDGKFAYSRILSVQLANGKLITVYPNPWQTGTPLQISNPNYEQLRVYFMNASGQHIGTSVTNTITLPTGVLVNQKGVVYYRIVNDKGDLTGTGSLLVK